MKTPDSNFKLLDRLIKNDKPAETEIYNICKRIIKHVHNSNEHKLTIVGLRRVLNLTKRQDSQIAKAAMLLSSQSFDYFDVYFKLYDETLDYVIEELDTYKYLEAVESNELIDNEGNSIENFQDRLFPYFVYKNFDSQVAD